MKTNKISPQEALKLLDQAWSYYTPTPKAAPKTTTHEDTPELFQYANAA